MYIGRYTDKLLEENRQLKEKNQYGPALQAIW